ncbi:MAG: FAD binding domain-containing protein [Kiritimatiellae bacterium]|nr:FAD binding domain-containing protein [Kiritimatiellia bacterium]
MKITDFKIPTRLDEALAALRDLGPAALPVAGATSLVFIPEDQPMTAVDLNRLGLDGIRRDGGVFRVGAATRVATLQKHREPGWVLDRVALTLSSQQIRNESTLGGNICRVFPWSDFPAPLLALGATLVIRGVQEREMPADEFFSSQPARLFRGGDLLTQVRVPALGEGAGFGYKKVRQTATGFSLATAAACLQLDGASVRSARAAVSAAVPFPARCPGVEAALAGKKASEGLLREAALNGLSALRFKEAEGMSAEYIGRLAAVTLGDVLVEAWNQAKEQAT